MPEMTSPETVDLIVTLEAALTEVNDILRSTCEAMTNKASAIAMAQEFEMMSALHDKVRKLANVMPSMLDRSNMILNLSRTLDQVADPATVLMFE